MRKQLENGFITYKELTVPERFIVIGEMGYSENALLELENEMKNEEGVVDTKLVSNSPKYMVFTGKMLQYFERYIQEISVTKDGKEITDYNELLNQPEYLGDLLACAMTMIYGGVTEEKKD